MKKFKKSQNVHNSLVFYLLSIIDICLTLRGSIFVLYYYYYKKKNLNK